MGALHIARAACAALLLLGPLGAGAQQPAPAAVPPAVTDPAKLLIPVDPVPVRAQVAARDFAGLEARFAAARATGDPDAVTALVQVFEDLPPDADLDLEAWADARPGSADARVALAQRELGRAWEARGTGYARTVTDDGRQAMRDRAARAIALADEASALDPRQVEGRRIQILCAQLLGDGALARRAFDAAFAVKPSHLGVWTAYQLLFQRRWGGSYEAQEQIAQAAQAHAGANPRLQRLLARAHRDRGRDLFDADRYAEALAAYDRALAYADDGEVRAYRAAARRLLGDPAGARAELEAGLAIDPYGPVLQRERYWLCMDARDFACMAAAAAREFELAPNDANARSRNEWAEWAVAHPAAARRALERNPVQDFLYRWGYYAYMHTFEGAALAALAGIGWYAMRARQRRREAADPLATLQRVAVPPPAAAPLPTRGPTMVERLPRTGVLMLRAYLYFQLVHHVLYYSELIRPGVRLGVLYVDIAISGTALAGALAFAHGVRLGHPWLWRLWAIAFPAWNQIQGIYFHGFTWSQWSLWGFLHLELLPVYTALFLYGWRCAPLWAGGLPGPGWAGGGRGSPRAPTPARRPARG